MHVRRDRRFARGEGRRRAHPDHDVGQHLRHDRADRLADHRTRPLTGSARNGADVALTATFAPFSDRWGWITSQDRGVQRWSGMERTRSTTGRGRAGAEPPAVRGGGRGTHDDGDPRVPGGARLGRRRGGRLVGDVHLGAALLPRPAPGQRRARLARDDRPSQGDRPDPGPPPGAAPDGASTGVRDGGPRRRSPRRRRRAAPRLEPAADEAAPRRGLPVPGRLSYAEIGRLLDSSEAAARRSAADGIAALRSLDLSSDLATTPSTTRRSSPS